MRHHGTVLSELTPTGKTARRISSARSTSKASRRRGISKGEVPSDANGVVLGEHLQAIFATLADTRLHSQKSKRRSWTTIEISPAFVRPLARWMLPFESWKVRILMPRCGTVNRYERGYTGRAPSYCQQHGYLAMRGPHAGKATRQRSFRRSIAAVKLATVLNR